MLGAHVDAHGPTEGIALGAAKNFAHGIVLAGGRGVRLRAAGPKALVRLDGVTLLDRSIATLRECCDDVIVVAPVSVELGGIARDGDAAEFSVVRPVIDPLERRPVEDERGECVVEPALKQIRFALAGIPGEAHSIVYVCVYAHASVERDNVGFCCERSQKMRLLRHKP